MEKSTVNDGHAVSIPTVSIPRERRGEERGEETPEVRVRANPEINVQAIDSCTAQSILLPHFLPSKKFYS